MPAVKKNYKEAKEAEQACKSTMQGLTGVALQGLRTLNALGALYPQTVPTCNGGRNEDGTQAGTEMANRQIVQEGSYRV